MGSWIMMGQPTNPLIFFFLAWLIMAAGMRCVELFFKVKNLKLPILEFCREKNKKEYSYTAIDGNNEMVEFLSIVKEVIYIHKYS